MQFSCADGWMGMYFARDKTKSYSTYICSVHIEVAAIVRWRRVIVGWTVEMYYRMD